MSKAQKTVRNFGSHGYTIHSSQRKKGWIFTQWSKSPGARSGMSMFIPCSERFPENTTWGAPWDVWDRAAELADFTWYALGALTPAQRREQGIRLLREGVVVSISPWKETDRIKNEQGETKCP